jgi:hypothetical protein
LVIATAPKKFVSNCRRNSSSLISSAKPPDREARVIDKHVNSPVIANHGVHELWYGVDLSNIERAHIDAVRNLSRGCRLHQPLAFSRISHAGDDPEPGFRQFHRSQ